MNANVGSTDKIVRLVLALVAVVVAFVDRARAASSASCCSSSAVVLAVTAFTGFCPLYRVLGMSTCPVRH